MLDLISPTRQRVALWLSVIVIFLTALGVARLAQAEDAQDVRGTKHGCQDVTATGAWVTLTSSGLENQQGSAALAASLYWTEVMVKGGSAAVYVCEAASADCGAGTTNKLSVATGAVLVIPLRGLGVQSIATYAANGATFQICGYFRTSP